MAELQTINPVTGELIQTYDEMSVNQVMDIIDATHTSYLSWCENSFVERANCLRKAATLLRKHKDKYANQMALEMGKPVKFGCAELEKCAWVCEYYADTAEEHLKTKLVQTDMRKSFVAYRPLGIIFSILPWNFPFLQVFRVLAPAVMAGNALLLSHAPISTQIALDIELLIREAGFPEHLYRALLISHDIAATVIAHDKIIGVTVTGSELAGSIVASAAGKALKKCVMELGGSDPYVILKDADLEKAAEACVASRMFNTGQVCIAAKRLIAVDAIREEFQCLVIEKVKRYQLDNPLDKDAVFGPMAREDLRDRLHKQVQQSIAKGATLITGGEVPNRKGFYYPPTILVDVKPGMPAYDTELFGPIIVFIDARDEAEAIHIANDTPYGLAAAVFTEDLKKGEEIATKKIHAGACTVNGFVIADPRLPFGGIKRSGFGRELSVDGIREFVNVKTVSIN